MSRRWRQTASWTFAPRQPKEYETKVIENGRLRWVCRITGRECPAEARCRSCLYPMMQRIQNPGQQAADPQGAAK